jgi:glutamate formiminotransferase/formiminotetrahydrofolate cyclodeaminase
MAVKQLIECVPNFSEGRDMDIIRQITDEIVKVEGVKLLDVDPGKATNRTVVTFVGEPKPVIEAAFRAIKKASEVIDMSKHSGEHPRMGATDVCPLIPISNITLDEVAEYARELGNRAGKELDIPIYLYEHAAAKKDRKNLASVRSGEYEGLADKLKDPNWKPDFGPAKFNPQAGATAIGARDFLIAYNVNLNTASVRRANSVAYDIREKGRIKRKGNPISGPVVLDKNGQKVWQKGSCKSVKAIGWFIEEYGFAQISMNITDISQTSLHKAFEECRKSANKRGMRVTGSELVGLVPKKVMIEAGKYYLAQQGRSKGISEEAIIDCAIHSLGLNELGPFDPKKKIIEYLLEEETDKLVDLNLDAFANLTASESPAPGGGSVSAYMGALGASLGTMVANLSAHKRGWDDQIEFFSEQAEIGQELKDRLVALVDEDTAAFNKIMDANRLPNGSEGEKKIRKAAIIAATKNAIETPLEIMQVSCEAYSFLKLMVQKGNPNSVTDAGVGALACRAAVHGAYLNVKINCAGFGDTKYVDKIFKRADGIFKKSDAACESIIGIVDKIIED